MLSFATVLYNMNAQTMTRRAAAHDYTQAGIYHITMHVADGLGQLLVTPWQYQYRGKNELVTVPFCKAMNCVAQALCRTKDDWWKTTN